MNVQPSVSLKGLMAPRSFWRSFWTTLLVWNPLLALLVGGLTAPHAKWGWVLLIGWIFASTISTTCIAASRLGGALLRAIRRWRGAPESTGRGHWRLSFAFSLFGVPFGYAAALRIVHGMAHALGFQTTISWHGSGPYLLLGCGIAGMFFLWGEWTYTRAALAASERACLHAQLAALSAQLNPHLLFNALNTIASLIPSDPQRAEEVVLRLAELYRGVLGATEKSSHSLELELSLCKAYLDVEQARFRERLKVDLTCDAGIVPSKIEVPVLLLQPLVENAIKHGISGRASGGRVEIRIRREGQTLLLAVEDDGVGLGQSTRSGAGVGVRTCRQRLELAYGEGASLSLEPRAGGGTRSVLRLPLPATAEAAA